FSSSGKGFYVGATNSENSGWRITKCSSRNRESGVDALETEEAGSARDRSPFRAQWLIPIIHSTIAEAPMASNMMLRAILKPYVKDVFLTDAIIQTARTTARKLIFGCPSENVGYTHHVARRLRDQGHHVSLKYTTRKDTIKNVERVIMSEELLRLKANNETMSVEERRAFVIKWKKSNKIVLESQLGSKNQSLQFVHGVFFAPSFTRETVPQLQRVFMADACHLNFGKYTLFTCYGVTANANMSPVAFGIVFGNENGQSWGEFWEFVAKLHPSMNSGDVTVITDQDKGQMNAIAKWIPAAGHFHCSHHRRGNIIKNRGGGGGKMKYSALWMYNKLLACRNVQQIQATKDSCFQYMETKDIAYLNKLNDTSQYPAARCNMRDDVYMYHRQSSSGAESMNAANFSVRQRTSVDLNNAMLLLIELECKRYRKQQAEAWNHNGILTPRGNLEFEESFNGLFHTHFRIIITERDDVWVCSVQRIDAVGREHEVTIPKEPVRESHFGRCTCGVDRLDSAPCEHMAAVAASSRLEGVTRYNVMPYWWTRAHWRKQFPQQALGATNVSMSSIISDHGPNKDLRYCPDWTAVNKTGRPKKDKRKPSVLESATGKKGAKRASGVKRARRYCQICGKYNHSTNECWELERNANKRPGFLATITENGEAETIGAEGTADASQGTHEDGESDQSEDEQQEQSEEEEM
ncbi:MAG: SWIM zinc finger family protein, partial [Sphaerospermopsis kisseleviana]